MACLCANYIRGLGCADLFYKKAARGSYSHLKTSIAVGLVMGSSAVFTLLSKNINYDFRNLYIYFPVSLMYISSMVIGYFGLQWLEVSVSAPIQNASGAVSSLLMMIVLRRLPDIWNGVAIILVTAGVVLLGLWERQENLSERRDVKGRRVTGAIAILFPVLYCFIDSLGTFLDGIYLDNIETTPLLGITEETIEDTANVSYQLTFLIVAIILFVYVYIIKRERLQLRGNGSRFLAALLETGGQLTYVYAISGNGIVAAPVIGSYCIASIVLSRIFLGERLSLKKYISVALVVAGIIIMSITEAVNG